MGWREHSSAAAEQPLIDSHVAETNTAGAESDVSTRAPRWFRQADCTVQDLERRCHKATRLHDYPFATEVAANILIYDKELLPSTTSEAADFYVSEVIDVLATGPGVLVVRGAFEHDVIDRTTATFESIIASEKETSMGGGDHFAASGVNDRVWNAMEKLALADPRAFVDYYENDIFALISRAWLGPGYQITSQVNVVGPGSNGQGMHRDYHLGFQGPAASEAYPAHIHQMSPMLTLQAAVAHVDMPLETGPTTFLPYSQTYLEGYLATHRDDFKEFYSEQCVQLPLAKGDLVVFNPATFHAAGRNTTESTRRVANLLQVSSPFGRAMETVDRARVCSAIYPHLLDSVAAGGYTSSVANAVAAAAEGYAFPTNLDTDGPREGAVPASQADIVAESLRAQLPVDRFAATLARQSANRRS